MFVEQMSWCVPKGEGEHCRKLLETVCRQMQASGGLIVALTGSEISCPERLTCVSFWNSWEDLARFLAHPRSQLFAEQSGSKSRQRPTLHHFEIIWQWPQQEPESAKGAGTWAFHEFSAAEDQIAELFDGLRQAIPRLTSHKGFCTAGLWVDENNPTHAVLVTQWAPDAVPDETLIDAALLISSARAKAPEVSCGVYRLHAFDRQLVGL